jgi:hypothetical protein
MGVVTDTAHAQHKQKFLRRFFQKAAAFLVRLTPLDPTAEMTKTDVTVRPRDPPGALPSAPGTN